MGWQPEGGRAGRRSKGEARGWGHLPLQGLWPPLFPTAYQVTIPVTPPWALLPCPQPAAFPAWPRFPISLGSSSRGTGRPGTAAFSPQTVLSLLAALTCTAFLKNACCTCCGPSGTLLAFVTLVTSLTQLSRLPHWPEPARPPVIGLRPPEPLLASSPTSTGFHH